VEPGPRWDEPPVEPLAEGSGPAVVEEQGAGSPTSLLRENFKHAMADLIVSYLQAVERAQTPEEDHLDAGYEEAAVEPKPPQAREAKPPQEVERPEEERTLVPDKTFLSAIVEAATVFQIAAERLSMAQSKVPPPKRGQGVRVREEILVKLTVVVYPITDIRSLDSISAALEGLKEVAEMSLSKLEHSTATFEVFMSSRDDFLRSLMRMPHFRAENIRVGPSQVEVRLDREAVGHFTDSPGAVEREAHK